MSVAGVEEENTAISVLSEQKQRVDPETAWCHMGTKAIQAYTLSTLYRGCTGSSD